MSSQSNLRFALVTDDQLESAHKLEVEGFPTDEAASLETFRYRQSVAPELFLGVYDNEQTLMGYISSTRSTADTITHESMSQHTAAGPTVCIHSVCVARAHHRKGIATRLLREYAERLSSDPSILRLTLICHQELVPFYENTDFKFERQSEIAHGSRPWFEMTRSLATSKHLLSSSNVLSALSQQPGNTGQHISYQDLPSAQLQTSDLKNAIDIVCPRNGCNSVILKAGVASHVIELMHLTGDEWSETPNLPALVSPVEWWLIEPSPMLFENIAFSKSTGKTSPQSGQGVKVLACAECEIGPLGWCEEGSTQFWLAARRVHYEKR